MNSESSMPGSCLNCGRPVIENYCSNCGQSTEEHTINLHFLWHDVLHGLFHFDKGILFTIKELFTRPGHSIREYIQGKRVQHFKPVSLVLILATVYGFLFHYFHINMLVNSISLSGSGKDFIAAQNKLRSLNDWVIEHYEIIALIQLPVYSFGTYLAFRKSGYNFSEHLVLNAFLTAQRLVLHIVAFPLYYLYNETTVLRKIDACTDVIGYALLVWSLIQFFYNRKKLVTFFKALLSLLIFFISWLLLSLIVVLQIIHA